MIPASKRPKVATPYQLSHAITFAVKPSARNVTSGLIESAECLFCIYYGKEEKVGKKRANTNNIKFFKHPFHSCNYTSHHSGQHSAFRKNYQALTTEDKKRFFEN